MEASDLVKLFEKLGQVNDEDEFEDVLGNVKKVLDGDVGLQKLRSDVVCTLIERHLVAVWKAFQIYDKLVMTNSKINSIILFVLVNCFIMAIYTAFAFLIIIRDFLIEIENRSSRT